MKRITPFNPDSYSWILFIYFPFHYPHDLYLHHLTIWLILNMKMSDYNLPPLFFDV